MPKPARYDEELALDQARTSTLMGFESPCVCGHEFGGHRFFTFELPQPCGAGECRCSDFRETAMLEPFADFGEPPEPELPPPAPSELIADPPIEEPEPEQPAQEALADAPGWPVVRVVADEATTPVRFPVLVTGATGIDFGDLSEPAQRVAELVEAIEPVLIPPPVLVNLEALVTRAAAIVTITDAESYRLCCEVYELLASNEKGIEESVGPVVAFFYRPWHAMTTFRARFAKPVAEHKKRLSDLGGAWKQAELRRADLERRKEEERAAEAERQNLRAIAEHAEKVGQPETAQLARQAVAEVTTPAIPTSHFSTVPATSTKGRKAWVATITDEDRFYRGLADGTIPRVAAPIDQAYLNRQATDLKQEFDKRYPGATATEKAGLTASGRR